MKDALKYKNFIGTVQFSSEDAVFYGKIEGINDLVTFEGSSVQELTSAFQEAAEDYIAICKQTGKPMEKSYKGSFNIRIDPDLHRAAARKATEEGITLNQLVENAIERIVDAKP
jgi:predicted HicB family RNase H-like nuclease